MSSFNFSSDLFSTGYGFSSVNQSSSSDIISASLGQPSAGTVMSDYASIKNGSYYKLLKAYYAKPTEKDKETSPQDQKIASDSNSLKKNASALTDMDFSTASEDQIVSAVKKFVDSYNDVISSCSDDESTNKDVLRNCLWMTNTTSHAEKLLSSVGITVNKDNTLALDEDTLKSASKSTLDTLFHGNLSYASKIAVKGSSIFSAASGTNKGCTYTGTGTFTSPTMDNIFDSLT